MLVSSSATRNESCAEAAGTAINIETTSKNEQTGNHHYKTTEFRITGIKARLNFDKWKTIHTCYLENCEPKPVTDCRGPPRTPSGQSGESGRNLFQPIFMGALGSCMLTIMGIAARTHNIPIDGY